LGTEIKKYIRTRTLPVSQNPGKPEIMQKRNDRKIGYEFFGKDDPDDEDYVIQIGAVDRNGRPVVHSRRNIKEIKQ
jgi:hypothetical protein